MWACVGELVGMLISVEGFLGNAAYWHWAMGVPLFLLVPALFILIKAPESPRYIEPSSDFCSGDKNRILKFQIYINIL